MAVVGLVGIRARVLAHAVVEVEQVGVGLRILRAGLARELGIGGKLRRDRIRIDDGLEHVVALGSECDAVDALHRVGHGLLIVLIAEHEVHIGLDRLVLAAVDDEVEHHIALEGDKLGRIGLAEIDLLPRRIRRELAGGHIRPAGGKTGGRIVLIHADRCAGGVKNHVVGVGIYACVFREHRAEGPVFEHQTRVIAQAAGVFVGVVAELDGVRLAEQITAGQ